MTDSCIQIMGSTGSMNLCSHGVYVNCVSCALEHRLNQLESLAKNNMSPEVKQLFDIRFESVFNRLERLEEILPSYDALHKEWMDRITKLEKLYDSSTDMENHLLNRIKDLERFQEVTHLEFHARNKKPYKCPVCDGNGWKGISKTFKEFSEKDLAITCVPCDGKGIVWR